MMEITAYRADGWPLCPSCGEDELWSPLIPDPIDRKPPIAEYIAAGLRCYRCGWELEARERVRRFPPPTRTNV